MSNLTYILVILFVVGYTSCSKPTPTKGNQSDNSIDSVAVEPALDTLSMTFGLSCWSNDSLILFAAGERPLRQKFYAVYKTDSPIQLTFIRSQQPEVETSRITADHFSRIAGPLFIDASSQLPSDETVLVVDSSFLESHRPLALLPANQFKLDGSTVIRIENARHLKIQSSWPMCRLGTLALASLVLFHPSDSTQILSLVLVKPDGLSFADYVADVDDDVSKWRVDDGGEFDPQYYVITSAFDSAGTLFIVRNWAGPEGGNSALYSESKGRLLPILEGYRYWVPESADD